MKCLIIDAVHSSIAEEFSKYMQVDTHMLPTQEELAKLIPDYDVLIMRVDPAINKEILDAAKNLKVIGVCSVGLNHIDLDTAKEKGIQVINAPGLNGNAVAELTIAKMLDIARHTIPACYDVKVNKTWDKYKFVGSELRGKTLGVLGFGRIGQRVGELARAFKMDVVAYDPYLPAHVFEEQHAKSLAIDEVLKVSDYVTIHMPLTDETRNLFNAKSIAEMKDGAVVLNMARVGIINIGAEDEKGNALVKDAFPMMAEAPYHFVGSVEARDLFSDIADVCVADGFAGNLVLKTMEGVAMFMLKTMKQELMADTRSKIGAALAKPALRRLKHTLDYTEVGGAPLLGVQGAVVKAHGSSNAHAFSCAIDQAIKMVNGHVVEIIEKGVAKMNSQDAQ